MVLLPRRAGAPVAGAVAPGNRSLGLLLPYTPQPLPLPWELSRPLLACGGELKSTFCLAKGRYASVSHHIGDLENYETLRSFTEGVGHFRRLFDVAPELVAHDLHPEYLSTKYTTDLGGVELVGVQHHHAHVAACLADNGETGPAIGVAFDGLGYGTDGTIWGGELLLADLTWFERLGHFEPVPMPGGAAAIREPWRMAAAYLDAAYAGQVPERLGVVRRNQARWADVVAVGRAGVGSPATSSAGRLFDAAAAILGCATRSTTKARPRWSWSSSPTRVSGEPTRPGDRAQTGPVESAGHPGGPCGGACRVGTRRRPGPPRDGDQQGGLTARVVECAKRQPDQPQDVTAPEAPAAAAQALELDLPALEDDERVTPLGLVVGPLAAGRDGNHPDLERR